MQISPHKWPAFFHSVFLWVRVVAVTMFVGVLARFALPGGILGVLIYPRLLARQAAKAAKPLPPAGSAVPLVRAAQTSQAARETLGRAWFVLVRIGSFCGCLAFIVAVTGLINRVLLHRGFYDGAGMVLCVFVTTTLGTLFVRKLLAYT